MKPGDHLLVCRWCRPQKGELVLVDNRSPLRERTAAVHRSLASRVNDAQVTFYIKRVAATEGQTPPPYSEKLWNEYRLPVPLSKIRAQLAPTPQKIPAGYVWLLGSNVNSIDSRFWGAVPLNLCKGTVLLVIPTHLSVL
nr:S26 family signal peptidase [Gloeobacter kilaueensis]